MDYRKIVTIFQVVMHIFAIVLCIWNFTLSGLVGLGGPSAKHPPISSDYYIWIAAFIGLGLILKLIFRQNDLIMPIVGLMVSVALFLLTAIFNRYYKEPMSYFEYISILLPICSILGLWIGSTRGRLFCVVSNKVNE